MFRHAHFGSFLVDFTGDKYLFAPVMRTKSCSWAPTDSQGAGLATGDLTAIPYVDEGQHKVVQ